MSHVTLTCILSVKIYFSLDSDSKYHEDQEKKGLHFFIARENGPKLYLCKYKHKQPDIAVKLRLTLFWLIFFFFCLAGSPMVISGRMLSSHPCRFFVKHEIQNGCHEITEVIF